MSLTRRGFFGTIVAAYVARFMPRATTGNARNISDCFKATYHQGSLGGFAPLKYKGVPIYFDENCNANQVYFMNADGPYVVGSNGAQSLVM